jgi:hypothetical protein
MDMAFRRSWLVAAVLLAAAPAVTRAAQEFGFYFAFAACG